MVNDRQCNLQEVQDNVQIFEFSTLEDKNCILEGRLLSFDRQILVLNDFEGSVPPYLMQFSHTPHYKI
jgi:hypothetical protein